MADKKISQLPNIDRVNYTSNDLLLINNGLAPYTSQTTKNTKIFDFVKYTTGHTTYVTGGTLNYGSNTLTFKTPVGNIVTTGVTNYYLTGGTYSNVTSAMTMTNNSGSTFSVTGMYFEKKPRGTIYSVQYNNSGIYFSGNTLIYESGTTSVYNRGHMGITGNTFFGEDAGDKTSLTGQTAFGYQTLYFSGSSGNFNTSFGAQSLYTLTAGTRNISIGSYNMTAATSSNDVVSVGSNAASKLTNQTNTVLVGPFTYTNQLNTSFSSNVAIGINSLLSGASSQNVILGSNAYKIEDTSYTPSGRNVVIGENSLSKGLSRYIYGPNGYSTIIGNNVFTGVTSNSEVTFPTIIGNNVGKNYGLIQDQLLVGNNIGNYTGGVFTKNTIYIGDGTKSFTNNSFYGGNDTDTFVGTHLYYSGIAPTRGNRLIIGHKLGAYTTSLSYLINIGYNNANVYNSRTESYNVLVGSGLLKNYSHLYLRFCTLIGTDVIGVKTTGGGGYVSNGFFTAIGYRACYSAATLFGGTHIGTYTSSNLNTLAENTTLGSYSLYNSTSSERSVALGSYSLYNINGTTGDNNAIGSYAGYNFTTGNQNTLIGALAGYNLTSGSNNAFIGYNTTFSATSSNNLVYIGNSSVNKIYSQQTSITLLSDERDKKNISDLNVGLSFINKLNPVIFDWNIRDGGKVGEKSCGFIAQEVEEVENFFEVKDYTNIVGKLSEEQLTISTYNLIPIMVKSLIELRNKNKELKERIKKLTL